MPRGKTLPVKARNLKRSATVAKRAAKKGAKAAGKTLGTGATKKVKSKK